MEYQVGDTSLKIATYACKNLSPENIDDLDDILKNEIKSFDVCALNRLTRKHVERNEPNPKTTRHDNILCWYKLRKNCRDTGFLLHRDFVRKYKYVTDQHKTQGGAYRFTFLDVFHKEGGGGIIFRIINCCVPEATKHVNQKFTKFLLDLKTFLTMCIKKHNVEPYKILLLGDFKAQLGAKNDVIKEYAHAPGLTQVLSNLKQIDNSYDPLAENNHFRMNDHDFEIASGRAKTRSKDNSELVVGNEGHLGYQTQRNFRGDMLIAFAYHFELRIVNSWFDIADKWTHLKGGHKREIDYLLCKNPKTVSDYFVHDILETNDNRKQFSDHRLLLFNVKSGENGEFLRIATYNCQNKGRQLNDQLSKDFFGARIQGGYDIIALTEFSTMLTSEQKTITLNGRCTLYSFGDKENRGTAFLLSKKFTDKYDHEGRKEENSRISSLDIFEKGTKTIIYRIINCYAPAASVTAERTIEICENEFFVFLSELKLVVNEAIKKDKIQNDKLLIMGDFNAQVGLKEELVLWTALARESHEVGGSLSVIAEIEDISDEIVEQVVGDYGYIQNKPLEVRRDMPGELLIALASQDAFRFVAVNTRLAQKQKWTYINQTGAAVRDYLFCQDIVNVSETYGIFNMKKNHIMFSKHRLLLFEVTPPKAFEVDLTTIFTRNNNANNGFDNLRNKICDLCTELSYFNNNPFLKNNFSTKFSRMFCDEILKEMFKSNAKCSVWANIVFAEKLSVRARVYQKPKRKAERKCTYDWIINLDDDRNNNNEPEPSSSSMTEVTIN